MCWGLDIGREVWNTAQAMDRGTERKSETPAREQRNERQVRNAAQAMERGTELETPASERQTAREAWNADALRQELW